jgi:hypothetical protein
MLDMVERSVSAMLVECVVERERPSKEVCRVFKDRFIDSSQRSIISTGVAWMVGGLRRRGIALLKFAEFWWSQARGGGVGFARAWERG